MRELANDLGQQHQLNQLLKILNEAEMNGTGQHLVCNGEFNAFKIKIDEQTNWQTGTETEQKLFPLKRSPIVAVTL